jgi:hypothetical protein
MAIGVNGAVQLWGKWKVLMLFLILGEYLLTLGTYTIINSRIQVMVDKEHLGCILNSFKVFQDGMFEIFPLARNHYFVLQKLQQSPGARVSQYLTIDCSHGELGLGLTKSATNAVKVETLEGFVVSSVSCGYGNTLLLIDSSNPMLKNLETIGKVSVVTEKGNKRKGEFDGATSPKKTKGELDSPKRNTANGGSASPVKPKA